MTLPYPTRPAVAVVDGVTVGDGVVVVDVIVGGGDVIYRPYYIIVYVIAVDVDVVVIVGDVNVICRP